MFKGEAGPFYMMMIVLIVACVTGVSGSVLASYFEANKCSCEKE